MASVNKQVTHKKLNYLFNKKKSKKKNIKKPKGFTIGYLTSTFEVSKTVNFHTKTPTLLPFGHFTHNKLFNKSNSDSFGNSVSSAGACSFGPLE